ncbi:extended synaptotagmin-3 [Salmo trutta]|uniref:Extended synaptotagmin-3 n=1 Tax=Salmo trutta TaxID=8032 RepID=A0A674B302_SALTR|nr:extended synaptotagmin-3-like [Salmo trutta]
MAEQLPVPTTTAPIASPTDKMYSGDSKGTVQGGGFGERSVPGSTGTLSPSVVNQLLMEFLMYFGRALLVFYPVYLTGYLGLSVIWILLCMMLIIWWKKNRKWKDIRIGTAMNFLDNETQVIHNELKTLNMATWVHFPEVEKVDWLNKIMLQAWPFFGMFMEKLLKEKIQPSIRLSSPYLKTFTFTKVHFGHTPLRITGLKVYTHEVDKRQVVMDLHISYDGDVDIDTEVKPPITAGVKSIRLQGMLRVILEPLIGNAPLVGGVTMFFIRRPTLQINWTGLTNLLDTPGLSHLSEPAIMDIIASLMVLPNRMCIPLIDQVKVDQMRFPLPRGVVRVHLLEARDLIAKDTYMMGMVKGKSDPYAVLRVGNIHFQSKTIQENLHPRWNEVYEFVVHEAPGQELEVDVFDEDTDKDDILGKFRLDFGEVKKKKEMDKWFPLDDVSSGEVHLKLQWLSLQTDPGLLVETSDGCACAMLAVYLDNASNLPKDHSEFSHFKKDGKHTKDAKFTRRHNNPNSYVEFSIDEQNQKSKVVFASKDPVWEECFTFFVHSITNQRLNIQVKEHDKKTLLGTLNVPLSRLLNTSDMTLDQRFLLERSGANSQIKMKATLRILTLEKPEPQVILNPQVILKPPPQPQPLQNPPTTSPTPSPSPLPSSYATPTAAALDSSTNGTGDYVRDRHGSFLAADGQRTVPSTPAHIRRFDSQSLLSENSIASSRFDLTEGAPYPDYIMNHQGTFGEIQLTVRYVTLRSRLIILVNSCRNLFACSKDGSDAYVRLYLLPDQSWKHRMRTQVKKKTVTPVFNEKFELDMSLEEAGTRKLDVAVKNNRMFHTRERKEIGMVQLDLSQMDLVKGFTEWYELTLPRLKKTV